MAVPRLDPLPNEKLAPRLGCGAKFRFNGTDGRYMGVCFVGASCQDQLKGPGPCIVQPATRIDDSCHGAAGPMASRPEQGPYWVAAGHWNGFMGGQRLLVRDKDAVHRCQGNMPCPSLGV